MKNITYAVSEERYTFGNETRTSYGIVAYSNADQDGTKTIVASVRDVTSDKVSLSKLVNDCNRLELSTIHLNDVVEDFLLQ
jgi:biotin synthase-related radical SAM superfamily protein